MRASREHLRAAVVEAQGDAFHGNGSAAAVLDHDDRANEGNPEVVGWCPKCEERAVPMRDGTCGFCETLLEPLPREEWPHTEGTVRRQEPLPEDDRRPGQIKRAREGMRARTPILPPDDYSPVADDTTDDTTLGIPDDVDDDLLDQEHTRIDPTQAPILDWLELHGCGTATQIAEALTRKPANVGTRLRQYEKQGYVRRTGRSLSGGRGGPQIEWELASEDKPQTSVDDVLETPLSPLVPTGGLRERYFDSLLALLDHTCPEHIFDRAERLLQEGQ